MDIALVTGSFAAADHVPAALLTQAQRADEPLRAALRDRGATVHEPVWRDADVDWSRYDLAVVRTTWDYSSRRDAFVAWATEVGEVTTLLNPPDVLRWNSHKSYLLELEERGAPVVPTAWLGQGDRVSVRELLAARDWTRAVIKPAVGAGAGGICRVALDPDRGATHESPATERSPAAAQRHLDALLEVGDVMIQPFLSTVSGRGELSVVVVDGQVSHAVRKHPADGDFRVQSTHGGRYTAEPVDPDVAALARWVVDATDADLLVARVDLIEDESGTQQLMELELIEPDLLFSIVPEAAAPVADAIMRRLRG